MALLQVKTEQGIVEGMPAGNQAVSIFRGIPFAKAPVGDLRWRAPQPPDHWEGVRKAYTFAPIAMQERFSSEGGGNTLAAQEFYCREYPMSEDCLYLNVWTPAESASEKLPVAIYFHGGAFETGYSYLNAYDGEGFAKRGIIMVSVAYRLGVFGYLALPELAEEDEEHHSTGNYGTMDQIAAIQWIKRNIEAFGGDPSNITLFGQSAGGLSVQNLCATPLVYGDFQHAIMQSAGGLSKGGVPDHITLEQAFLYGAEYKDQLHAATLEEARALDAQTLIQAYSEMKGGPGYLEHYRPCVDGYVHPEPPDQYFRKGRHPDIDTMIGCTAAEFRQYGKPSPEYEEIQRMAKARYGAYAEQYLRAIHADQPELCQPCFEDIIGDDVLASNLAWCENQNLLGRKPAYLYYFTYVPPGAEKAHHSAEHHYVFQTLVRSKRPYTGFDYDLSNELADYWANFMKTGNPNGGQETWTPFTEFAPKALIIDRQRYMDIIPRRANVAFHVEFSLGKLLG